MLLRLAQDFLAPFQVCARANGQAHKGPKKLVEITGRAYYFRKKGMCESFSLSSDRFKLSGRRIRIPGLDWVRMREFLRFPWKILSALSRTADH